MELTADVAILGAGVAGLTAAWRLSDLDAVVLEADSHVGGRTLSKTFEDGSWANFAAQYVSDDKTRIVEIADALGLELTPSGFHSDEFRMAARPDERADIDVWTARLRDEMSRPRPADAPELDRVTVAEWLDGAPACVHDFFERWCGQLLFASTIETSLYGLMPVWGDQRTSAFATEPVARGNRGDTVFRGGTGGAHPGARRRERRDDPHPDRRDPRRRRREPLPDRGAGTRRPGRRPRAAGGRGPAGDGRPRGDRRPACRQGRGARPGPLRPQHRHAHRRPAPGPEGGALSARAVAPRRGLPRQRLRPEDARRRRPRRRLLPFLHPRTATPASCGTTAPDSIRSGAFRAFSAAHPDLAERVHFVGFKRWRHALPHMYPGRMADLGLLRASVGPIHFCGDYTWTSNMDGAARSGDAAAAGVRAALEGRAAAS